MSGAARHRRRERTGDPRRRPARGDAPTVREHLRRLGQDADYLAVKDALGEPLSAEERAILDAARARDGRGGAS